MSHVESDDHEALVPHTHAVLGLKVADTEEAQTVRRVGGAVLGLMVLLGLHFIVHVAHHGHVLHAVGHLLTAAVLPAAGYIAVSQRSTKATWAFHLMAVISSMIHAILLVVVVVRLLELQAEGTANPCAKFEHPCVGAADWRCLEGLCIEAARHCDGEANCFDGSDELGCLDAAALGENHVTVTVSPGLPGKDMEECRMYQIEQKRAPMLQLWWFFMSLPMWGLCLYAAYHSLEFYVQLRLRRLSARVDRTTADATVFDRSGHDGDEVAE